MNTMTRSKGIAADKRNSSARGATATKARTKVSLTPAPPFRIRTILFPTDFSNESRKILADYAAPMAAQLGAKLTLLHVIEPVGTPDFAASFPLSLNSRKLTAYCNRQLEQMASDINASSDVVDNTSVRFGRACDEIADAAQSTAADLIIIPTHGYTGLKHALLGSTAERVARHASCPVLLARS